MVAFNWNEWSRSVGTGGHDRRNAQIGTFSLKTKGPKQEVTGKYVVVWEKVGTDWQLATDIWNDGK